jgi:hypothetical protein
MVAEDERIGAAVIDLDVQRHGQAAVYHDEVLATFVESGSEQARRPAGEDLGRSARVVVEVQRRFGGLAPRALLGAEFIVNSGAETVFHVGFSAIPDPPAACPSRLWTRPFTVGLPEEFAPAVLDGLVAEGATWPPGVLRVDRAGFDEVESSSVIFEQTATALARALAASLRGTDIEEELRTLMLKW